MNSSSTSSWMFGEGRWPGVPQGQQLLRNFLATHPRAPLAVTFLPLQIGTAGTEAPSQQQLQRYLNSNSYLDFNRAFLLIYSKKKFQGV